MGSSMKVIYFFLNDENSVRYQIIPAGNLDSYPEYPTPEDMEFDVKNLAEN